MLIFETIALNFNQTGGYNFQSFSRTILKLRNCALSIHQNEKKIQHNSKFSNY